jgi:nicotinamidase-related amidase
MLPLPQFAQPYRDGVWRVPYQDRAAAARTWAETHGLQAASGDRRRIGLVLIDVQNTFCLPDFELYVSGAPEDSERLCSWIYRHLDCITQIWATMDTHTAAQIFHPLFWCDAAGNPPTPAATVITPEAIADGTWHVNGAIAPALGLTPTQMQDYATYYVRQLSAAGKYPLTVWGYHSMLGGIGHALVSAVEEALFFHGIARQSQPKLLLKGSHPLTENYSVLRPEVNCDPLGQTLVPTQDALIEEWLSYDALFIAGQAKSHCVAWTLADLLSAIRARDPLLARKIHLLEDCTSPVVVPGVVDFSSQANDAFAAFAEAGMRRCTSQESLQWLE